MVMDERVRIERGFLSTQKEKEQRVHDGTKLLVSLHGIEFSQKTEDYREVSPGVWFSNLLYLLYVRKVEAGNDFETVKERAKSVLILQLEKMKYSLLTNSSAELGDEIDVKGVGRRLVLINRAISFLEDERIDHTIPNCEIYEV